MDPEEGLVSIIGWIIIGLMFVVVVFCEYSTRHSEFLKLLKLKGLEKLFISEFLLFSFSKKIYITINTCNNNVVNDLRFINCHSVAVGTVSVLSVDNVIILILSG